MRMPLYYGPYLVLEPWSMYFCLQLGSRTDVISVDHLKPAFSEDPISAALPPAPHRPALHPALHAPDPPPFVAVPAKKGSCSSFHHLFLLGRTLAGPYMTEGPALPFLRRSFCGDSCGGLMSATLFLSFRITTRSRCTHQLLQDD